jgi:hypothetical protein
LLTWFKKNLSSLEFAKEVKIGALRHNWEIFGNPQASTDMFDFPKTISDGNEFSQFAVKIF